MDQFDLGAIVKSADAAYRLMRCHWCGEGFRSIPTQRCCSVKCDSALARSECGDCGEPITDTYYYDQGGIGYHLKCAGIDPNSQL